MKRLCQPLSKPSATEPQVPAGVAQLACTLSLHKAPPRMDPVYGLRLSMCPGCFPSRPSALRRRGATPLRRALWAGLSACHACCCT